MSDAVSCFVISLWIAQNSGLLRIIADTLTKADHEFKYWRCGDHQYDMYAFGLSWVLLEWFGAPMCYPGNSKGFVPDLDFFCRTRGGR